MGEFAALRKAAGLTQVDASEALGVDRSTVAKWETGESMPTAAKLPQIAALYKCEIGDLFEKVEGQEKPPA